MMFSRPPFVKQYVVIAFFGTNQFYLHDAGHLKSITVRTWTTKPKKAIKFDNKGDAETIAAMVCCDDVDYKIGGISKIR